MKAIREAVSTELLKAELTAERFLRVTRKGENEIYVVNCHNAPNVLEEIGRLREVTFRAAGGGTGESIDLDEYDLGDYAYEQLIVWSVEDEAIIGGYRFKKCQDGLFLSLVQPDFNVLPLIERHFRNRYQDQRWLIYDERRNFGIYYDLTAVHQVEMDVDHIDHAHKVGHSQSFSVELDDDELLYDQLWKDYFKSINIEARTNIKLHVQYVPKRYWRYMNEKTI